MPLTDSKGGVPPRKHRLERSNIERDENENSAERGFQKFRMQVNKIGGLVREVKDEADLADALAKGWHEDIRTVPDLEPNEAPDRVSRMTIAQAVDFIAEHQNDAAKLVEIRADETSHGNRVKVMQAIADAENNFGAPGTRTAATPKTAPKSTKKPTPKKK